MRITLFKFCDYCARLEGGKGMIIGMFDTIHVGQLPFVQRPFHICVEFEFDHTEFGRQANLEMSLIDEDANQLMGIRGELVIPSAPAGRPVRIMQDFLIENLQFNAAGTHRVDILFNGLQVGEERLYIEQQLPPKPV